MKLLYLCAEWHALAKLRLHNDLTLRRLDNTTTLMTDQFRVFMEETCSQIATYELKSERDARSRRAKRAKTLGTKKGKEVDHGDDRDQERRQKHFNIKTYKFHALGDYVDNIKMFGTTDSFSTEVASDNPKLVYV
jgi:DNA invertase Pin-like site-specific DNA recombinase